jgi:hypothetical protein
MRPFNDTDNGTGLVQMYELEIGAEPGFVSGSTARLKRFASDTRSAWNRYCALAFKAEGRWEYDDSNHPDYAIIKTALVAGQRDYTFLADEQGNLILDIYGVAVLRSATATQYEDIIPVDELKSPEIVAESAATGIPEAYGKRANGIFLDTPSSYDAPLGLKVYINRTPSYFTHEDTTKKPGCPALHHDYFFLRPAFEQARRKSLANYVKLRDEVIAFEGDEENGIQGSIERHFARRSRDENPQITMKKVLYV